MELAADCNEEDEFSEESFDDEQKQLLDRNMM